MQPAVLSRTSSATSISSDDAGRRTRKRFTSVQLMMLEQVYHHSSHPTREEREALANTAGMEMKSVTIWFQNKRQTERKVILHNATSVSNTNSHPRMPSSPFTSVNSSSSLKSAPPNTSSAASSRPSHGRTHSSSSVLQTPHRKITPPRPRPSLDRVATRSESRRPPPRTPTKPRNPHASLWDNMPSSPLGPPPSPPAREYLDFVGSGRTLEWACAAARIAGKEGRSNIASASSRADVGDETEEEDEIVTPSSSIGPSHTAWRGEKLFAAHTQKYKQKIFPTHTAIGTAKNAVQDDDMMRAALALCGLGRRSA
ncbi:homeobox-domain-containing protein [Hygrophoropsis aurantiaca]|uniref:Homeobox-domain-containing protein n=1 Tax=Hygrophoropsis aurantiaca TaxID=72124 RepID=A0ACB8AE64_9AGAM|nr:homeobox-domain-containing protein [Hygrophoropsis aurantiaca]